MSIIGDPTKYNICEFGVPCIDFLGFHIKPVKTEDNDIKSGKSIKPLSSYSNDYVVT